MSATRFILFSPGPVDGYPPVQYQAQLLAAAGHSVEVVTSPLSSQAYPPAFSFPGVMITCISPGHAFAGRLKRNASYVAALLAARRRAGRDATEICYDPIGLFLSDCCPLRPRWRVAHFHELLQYPESFLEKRLRRAIKGFQLVVVPDEARARHTAAKLDLKELPAVVENYPLRADGPFARSEDRGRFEVIYCGSLGFNQKLDVAIRSSALWPEGACLTLIGQTEATTATALRSLAEDLGVAHRVQFVGWLETPAAERRLAQANLALGLLDTGSEQMRTALGASNKRFQYMKAGLPQIGDQNPGIPDLIEGGGIGTCLRVHEPGELAAVVEAYMQAPDRCETEGSRAFLLHQQHFNYEAVFGRLLDRLAGLR